MATVTTAASKTKLVLTCHMDVVEAMSGQQEWTVTGERVTGTLDNLAGCAVVFSLLDELRQADAEVHFTQHEEIDLRDAYRIARRLKDDPNALVLVVDTGNARADEDVIVANDYRFDGLGLARRLRAEGLAVAYEALDLGNEDTEDESWAFAKSGVPCVSVYLPVIGDFHTPEAHTTTARIAKLRHAILRIVALIHDGTFGPESKYQQLAAHPPTPSTIGEPS